MPHLSIINGIENWILLKDRIIHSIMIVLSRRQKYDADEPIIKHLHHRAREIIL
jgi:hypothetical protein